MHNLISRNAIELVLQNRHFPPFNVYFRWRSYSTSSPQNDTQAPNIAVLGGGITGLASAYYLTQKLPNARVTLFEGSDRLGGWLQSKQVDVGTGKVVFEQGPRTLRPTKPNGWLTIELLRDLGLEDQALTTAKSSVAAQRRFIYYPDRLVRIPGPGSSLWSTLYALSTEPVFQGSFYAILSEITKSQRQEIEDESIGSFISRRFSSSLANNLVSAGIHGIYAGDVYQLSARSILPSLWYGEAVNGSIVKGLVRRRKLRYPRDQALYETWRDEPQQSQTITKIRDCSVFTFKEGVGQLAAKLEAALIAAPKVDIKRQKRIHAIDLQRKDDHSQIELTVRNEMDGIEKLSKQEFTHVISTLSSKTLHAIVKPQAALPSLAATPFVTVMVVNLFYSNPALLPVHGFGYLLPRSLKFEQNPEFALGVVFDSDATIGQDSILGTKVTVMLGGHWWDEWESFPDEGEGASMAKAILRRHLGITEDPQAIRVGLQRDCIPQYTVGHYSRMMEADKVLRRFKGRLRVAGNSYTGVGLNDCVRAARDIVAGLVDNTETTGLEFFARENDPTLA